VRSLKDQLMMSTSSVSYRRAAVVESGTIVTVRTEGHELEIVRYQSQKYDHITKNGAGYELRILLEDF